METVRILIADDHPLFRDGLRLLLQSMENLQVIGEATSGEEAVTHAAELSPDIVLMDIQMPGLNGLEATRRIRAAQPEVRVIVLTMFEDDESLFAAMRVGAQGYILKGARQGEVQRAILAVINDEVIFGAQVARRMMRYFQNQPASHFKGQEALPQLTDREFEVLNLIAQRLNNNEIAARLVLSPKTVRNHVSNIFAKLQAADRAEAIRMARSAGLGTESSPEN